MGPIPRSSSPPTATSLLWSTARERPPGRPGRHRSLHPPRPRPLCAGAGPLPAAVPPPARLGLPPRPRLRRRRALRPLAPRRRPPAPARHTPHRSPSPSPQLHRVGGAAAPGAPPLGPARVPAAPPPLPPPAGGPLRRPAARAALAALLATLCLGVLAEALSDPDQSWDGRMTWSSQARWLRAAGTVDLPVLREP